MAWNWSSKSLLDARNWGLFSGFPWLGIGAPKASWMQGIGGFSLAFHGLELELQKPLGCKELGGFRAVHGIFTSLGFLGLQVFRVAMAFHGIFTSLGFLGLQFFRVCYGFPWQLLHL
jgi:hypothetical protein